MKKKYNVVIFFILLLTLQSLDAKRLSKSRGSGSGRGTSSRGSSKTSYSQPSPTSHSNVQSAAKPSLSGWRESTAQKSQPQQSKPSSSQSHSYPSSQTGLSGNSNHGYPQSNGVSGNSGTGLSGNAPKQTNQQNHGYPASNGMSGSSGTGLSGSVPKQANQQNHAYPPPGQAAGGAYPHPGANTQYSGSHPQSNVGAYGGNNYANNHRSMQGPPPPYQGNYGPNYGGFGGNQPHYSPQMPGYFGNYGNTGHGFGGVSRSRNILTGVGIAGAGVGTVLTGLALWNLARSTGHNQHTVIYDNRGQPVAVAPDDSTSPVVDSILKDLINCTLTISNGNATEILEIPCAIATSFTPDADVKDKNGINDNNESTKCTITVVTKEYKEFMTTIPCSILLKTAAENNVTEPPMTLNGTNEFDFKNETAMEPYTTPDRLNGPPPGLTPDTTNINDDLQTSITNSNCTTIEPGEVRDPINPCYAVTHNVTVKPLTDENDKIPSETSTIN